VVLKTRSVFFKVFESNVGFFEEKSSPRKASTCTKQYIFIQNANIKPMSLVGFDITIQISVLFPRVRSQLPAGGYKYLCRITGSSTSLTWKITRLESNCFYLSMLRERIFQINLIFNIAEMQLPWNFHPYVRDIGYYYYCYYFKSGKILDFIFLHLCNVD
jgi:hypothetical protein